MVKTLIIVRHGETLRNILQEDDYSINDSDTVKKMPPTHLLGLTENGINQAEEIVSTLKDLNIKYDSFIHSGMVRSRETLKIIQDGLGFGDVKVHQVPLIRERIGGYGYFLTKDELNNHYPYLQENFRLNGQFHGIPPGGESLIEVCDRLSLFLNNFFDGHYGDNVLIVSHGFAMRGFKFLLEEMPIEEVDNIPKFGNCDFLQYEGDRGNMKLIKYHTTGNRKEGIF